jgi:23S rRNA pseudouridine1911/1915/1917 synthase
MPARHPRKETLVVAAREAHDRLDRLLAARTALSRTRLKALILEGAVTIGPRTIRDPGYRVNAGEVIAVAVPEPEPAEPGAESIPLDIVYEDEEIIVIDKPAGLVVHPAAGHATGTLVNALIAHCGDSLSGIGGVKRPGIVHRLDKDTTVLMVAAKTDRAHQSLAAQFADHGRTGPLERGYLAFVWGAPSRPKGTIEAPIDRHPKSRDRMAVRAGGRPATTHWQVLERFAGRDGKPVASLIACRLATGRTHQIRVHLASLGHHIVGDTIYATASATREDASQAIELRAIELRFAHPRNGREITCVAPGP